MLQNPYSAGRVRYSAVFCVRMLGGCPGDIMRRGGGSIPAPESLRSTLPTYARRGRPAGTIRASARPQRRTSAASAFLVAKPYYSEILVAFFVSEKLCHSFSERCLDTITMFSAPEGLWGRYSVSFASQEVPRASPEHSNTEYRRIPQPTGRIPVLLHLSQIQYIKNLE